MSLPFILIQETMKNKKNISHHQSLQYRTVSLLLSLLFVIIIACEENELRIEPPKVPFNDSTHIDIIAYSID